MDIVPGYNPIEKKVIIKIKTNLFDEYLPNFIGFFIEKISDEKNTDIPEGLVVEEGQSSEALIMFPLPKTASEAIENMAEEGKGYLKIEKKNIDSINSVINDFVQSAIRHKLKTTEFIPLEGYSFDSLQEEIKDAAKNKRKLCVIKDFSEYLAMKKGKYEFNQYVVEPESEEYADLVLMLLNKESDKIKQIYLPKLSLTEWI